MTCVNTKRTENRLITGGQHDDLRVAINMINATGANSPVWKQIANDGTVGADYAVEMNGTDEYLELPDYAALDSSADYTVECWVKPHNSTFQIAFRDGYFDFYVENGTPSLQVLTGSYLNSNNDINVGASNHVAFTATKSGSSTRIRIYVNGVLSGTQLTTGNLGANASDVWFGRWSSGYFLSGAMDEIVIYNKALSAAQILERFASGAGTQDLPTDIVEATDVIAHVSFTEGTGSTADNDCTLGAGEDIDLINTTTWVDGLAGGSSSGSLGVFGLAFEKGAVQSGWFSCQLSHGYKYGSALQPHVHWSKGDAVEGNVVWKLEYIYAKIGEAFTNTATVEGHEVYSSIVEGAKKHYMTNMTDIDNTDNDTVSSMLMCRLYRDVNDANDTYPGDAFLWEFDFHFEKDTIGSTTVYSK